MTGGDSFTHRMVQTVFTVAAVAILVAGLWVIRSSLMIIYVSAIVSMGFSPLVGVIERKSSGRRRIPRTLAILTIYLAIVGTVVAVGMMVIPPLIEQGGELWS